MLKQPFFFILTGAMGSGKSTIIEDLSEKGILCIAEPAREILSEQRKIKADGVPEMKLPAAGAG